jgi:3-phenylpropionate/trans-cinnamate dioxygenase ferredoxin subunit
MSAWTRVCSVEELPPGARREVDLDGVAALLVNVAGQLLAVEDLCTHDGAPLGDGRIDGDQVVCPRHGARFCLRTGAALSPPAYSPIACFPVRVVDGQVEVRDARWDPPEG